jgi:hypothetical protein
MHPIDELSMHLSRLRGVPFPSVIKKISENKEQQNELRQAIYDELCWNGIGVKIRRFI